MTEETLLHATCVSIQGKGVLLLGESGTGKTDLAFSLIDSGASLVADDQVKIIRSGETLFASPPQTLKGMIEARGFGILRLPYEESMPLAAAFSLSATHPMERLPEPQQFHCLGLSVPLWSVYPFEASAAAKIRLWMQHQGK